jgi:hypothetical protein
MHLLLYVAAIPELHQDGHVIFPGLALNLDTTIAASTRQVLQREVNPAAMCRPVACCVLGIVCRLGKVVASRSEWVSDRKTRKEKEEEEEEEGEGRGNRKKESRYVTRERERER